MHNPIAFATTDADIILRSCDGVELGVYRRILAEASPFFKDLFSLPQPVPDESNGVCASIPIVDVPERADVIEKLLQLVYPGTADPAIHTLDELGVLLAVAMKYDMLRAIATLRRLLVAPRFVEKEPTRVYAIACRHDLEPEAAVASAHTLRVNVLDCPLSEDLKHITAWSYHRLLDLHRRRAVAAQAALALDENIKCMQCSSGHYGALNPPRWWSDWECRAKEELSLRPTTDVVFSMAFLSKSGQTGCQRCPGSILESYAFLERLKTRIDELPSTI